MQQKFTPLRPANPTLVWLAMALWLLCTFSSDKLQAQTWIVPFCSSGPPSATTSATYGPMNSVAGANATSRIAIIYPASQLATIAGSTINNIYFNRATASGSMAGSPNFKIYLKEVSAADWGTGALTWATEIASATLVYNGNPAAAVGSASGWKNFALTAGFPYSGTQNLAVLMEYQNTTASTGIVWSYEYTSPCVNTGNSNTTKYSNNTTGTFPATLATSNYRRPYIGFDFTYPPCGSATNLPTAATITASPNTICVTGNVTLTFNPATTMPNVSGITYVWQSSPNNTTFGDIATTTVPTYTVAGLTTTTWYRCKMLCGTTTLITTASQQVVVNNPGTPTAIPASRCGPGAITLGATPPAGSTINWFQNSTGGAPLGTGNTYNTGYIPATTTFYAAAAAGSTPATQWVGTGTSTAASPFIPYYDYYYGDKVQYLIRASELIAAGFGAGTINSMGFDVTSVTSNFPLSSFSIAMKQTTATQLTTTFETGLTPVYNNASYQPVANSVNTHVLTTPFPWDGTSNIVIEVCHNNNGYNLVGPAVSVKYTDYGYDATHYDYDDNASQCASPSGFLYGTTTSRPNIRFNMTVPCMGPRIPVVATITTPPAVTKTFPAVVCSDAVTPITVASSPMSNYTSYTWTPVITNLYTNAAATLPYMGGSSPTVYMKSDVVGNNVYYLYASGATPAACTYADTVRIWVQPDSVTILGQPDSICMLGSTTLKLQPDAGYAPNSIQWQESATGTPGSYANITGATGVTYTTPTLSANHYYRALIKSTNDTCERPVKYAVVVNPTLLGVTDSFNCGPGSVTLKALTGGNSSAVWYDAPTGGMPVGSGTPWTTPYLGATQTYYVSAQGGGGNGDVILGTGTTVNSTTDYPTPFGNYYGASHDQYLIRASELTAAGAVAGSFNSIAFDLSSAYSYAALKDFTIKMAATTQTALTTNLITTGFVTVKPASNYTPPATTGYTTINFATPFSWDGVSNIVVDVSFLNCTTCNGTASCATTYTYNGTVRQTGTSYASAHSVYIDDNCTINTMTPTGAFFVNTTFNQRPNMKFVQPPCATTRLPVTAYIRPVPVVDLGPDINECVEPGAVEVLDAGVQPNSAQYLWDNGSVSQVRAVNQSGTYSVKVTNQYACSDVDSIAVLFRRNPAVNLGNDTTVCNGVVLPLNAGPDGIDYFWSTGQTTQTIEVNTAGSYNVFVTNNQGCVKTDTILVHMAGELPTVQGINVSNNGINTFHFTAVNPQNVVGYDWDFGDNTPHSYQAAPYHTYASAGNYIVVLHLSSSCGFQTDSTSAHIVGIHQLSVSNNELTVYPNPAKEIATIVNNGALKMESVSVYNVLGQVVYKAAADSKDRHMLQLTGFASGVYTIQVFTDKGTVARKLEIIK